MNRRLLRGTALLLICLSALFLLSACIGSREQESDESVQSEAAVVRDLVWAVGTEMPLAKDFFLGLQEGDTVSFAEKDP